MGKNKNKNKKKREKQAREEKEQNEKCILDAEPEKESENKSTTKIPSTKSEDEFVRENWDDDDGPWEVVEKKKPRVNNGTWKNDQKNPERMEIDDEPLHKKKEKSKRGSDHNMEWENGEEDWPNFGQPLPHRKETQRKSRRTRSSHRGYKSNNHVRRDSSHQRDNNSRASGRHSSSSTRESDSQKRNRDHLRQRDDSRHKYDRDRSFRNEHDHRNDYQNRFRHDTARDSYHTQRGTKNDYYRGHHRTHLREDDRKNGNRNDYHHGHHKTDPGVDDRQNEKHIQNDQRELSFRRKKSTKDEGESHGKKNNKNQNYNSGQTLSSEAKSSDFNKNSAKVAKKEKFLFIPNANYYEPTIREIKGDLFYASEEYSLAHCVAEDLSMGAGIAVEFKKRFKGVEELRDQGRKTGEVAILQKDNRFIFYLITKKRSTEKPTIHSLKSAIIYLRNFCLEYNVKKLAIPRIGCGLDRLDWGEVKDILYQEFSKTDIEIVVYVW